MKFVRLIVRLAVLLLAAASFIGLTLLYGRASSPDPQWWEGRAHRASAPDASRFLEIVPGFVGIAIFAVGGRLVLRLRLSPASRAEGKPISLGLDKVAKAAKSS
jgi:hypothetical protein